MATHQVTKTTSNTSTEVKTVESEELRTLLQNCNPQAQAELRALWRDHNALVSNNLTKMWTFGRRITNLKKEEYRKPRSGDEPIDTMKLVGQIIQHTHSDSYCNKMAQLYRAFPTEADRDRLVAMRSKGGRPLTWPHLEQLLKFLEEGNRALFDAQLQRCLDEELTPDQLAQLIKQTNRLSGKSESRGGGRPTLVPKGFLGRATRFIEQVQVMVKNSNEIYDHADHNFLNTLKDMPQAEIAAQSEELLDLITTMRNGASSLRDIFDNKLQNEFPAIEEYVQSCVVAAAAQAGASEAAELEAADLEVEV